MDQLFHFLVGPLDGVILFPKLPEKSIMVHVEHDLLLHFLLPLLALDHTFVKLNVQLFLILHKLINLPQHDVFCQTYLFASLIGWNGRFVQLEFEAGVLP